MPRKVTLILFQLLLLAIETKEGLLFVFNCQRFKTWKKTWASSIGTSICACMELHKARATKKTQKTNLWLFSSHSPRQTLLSQKRAGAHSGRSKVSGKWGNTC